MAPLPLSAAHRADLQRRGFPDAEIDLRGYRTWVVQGRARMAGELRERFGDSVFGVPGFITRQGRGPYLTLAGPAGLLIPVRDLEGRILALKIRRDGNGRYCYLSSTNEGGPGPGSPVHVPLGIQSSEKGRLTEGERKADAAFVLSGIPTISAPGASNWRVCIPILKKLGWKTVLLTLDADARVNPNVARALEACAQQG